MAVDEFHPDLIFGWGWGGGVGGGGDRMYIERRFDLMEFILMSVLILCIDHSAVVYSSWSGWSTENHRTVASNYHVCRSIASPLIRG